MVGMKSNNTNRMRLIPQTDLDDIVKLARAAMRLHEGVTHYGKCDICDLVTKWRRLRDDSIDVNGTNEWREWNAKREVKS